MNINDLMEHCLQQIRKHPYSKIGFEHYILLQCLQNMSQSEFEKIKSNYKYIIKEDSE